MMAAARGRRPEAARFFGAAQALRAAGGAPFPLPGRDIYDETIVGLRAGLGPEAYETERRAGASVSLAEILAEAEAELLLPAGSAPPAVASDGAGVPFGSVGADLTARSGTCCASSSKGAPTRRLPTPLHRAGNGADARLGDSRQAQRQIADRGGTPGVAVRPRLGSRFGLAGMHFGRGRIPGRSLRFSDVGQAAPR